MKKCFCSILQQSSSLSDFSLRLFVHFKCSNGISLSTRKSVGILEDHHIYIFIIVTSF